MRMSWAATLPLLGVLMVAPERAPAQVSVTLRLGNPIVVTNYAPEAYGDWHTRYEGWRPVTVYYYQGRWYPRAIRGARAVVVYRSGTSYFLPPRDRDWDNRDHRYNYRRRPVDDDYNHVAPPPQNGPGRGRGRGRGRGHGPE